MTPDIDRGTVSIRASTLGTSHGDYLEITLSEGERTVSTAKAAVTETVELPVPDARLWSPDSPFLYALEIKLLSQRRVSDRVASYCAMRKISAEPDENGVMRLLLNNARLFHLGLLDQGWWPDGLYTAPTDQALVADIAKAKELGFNMLRKHIKVEPARWYYHCDRIGMLVWQDMPSGDNNWGRKYKNYMRDYVDNIEVENLVTIKARENYKKEWGEIIDALYSHPCIVMWIPFNEGWGQFETQKIAEWTKFRDPSRILNPASGGNFYHTGEVLDQHHYPAPSMHLYDPSKVNVVGEYGGIGYAVKGHLWQEGDNFGYEALMKNQQETTSKYIEYLEMLKKLDKYSGAVYTQFSDVEGEINGLNTYDRKKVKVDESTVRKANRELIRLFSSRSYEPKSTCCE